MNALMNCKFARMLEPKDINGAAATCQEVDCQGFHAACVIVQAGAIGAADFDSLSITECDTTGGSFTAIPASAGVFTAPLQTDDNLIWVAFIDLRKRMRFLKPIIDAGAVASLASCVCLLYRADQSPGDNTERGTKQTLVF
jgi:hypothetical protein